MLLGIQRVVKPRAVFFLNFLIESFVKRQRRNDDLLRFELGVKFLDGGDDFLDLSVAEFEGVRDGLFGNFESTGFHHDDGFFRAGDDDVQETFLLLGDGWIGDELAVEQTHADGGDGFLKREVRAVARGGSSGDGDDIGIVVAVSGKHHADDLGFIAPSFGKERAKRAVNQAGSENFFFGRPAFAFEEAAGNFSSGIGVFTVIDSKRKKVAIVGSGGHASSG